MWNSPLQIEIKTGKLIFSPRIFNSSTYRSFLKPCYLLSKRVAPSPVIPKTSEEGGDNFPDFCLSSRHLTHWSARSRPGLQFCASSSESQRTQMCKQISCRLNPRLCDLGQTNFSEPRFPHFEMEMKFCKNQLVQPTKVFCILRTDRTVLTFCFIN